MPIEPAEILFHDEVMQLASWRDLFVERWTAKGTPRHLAKLTEEHQRFIEAKAPAKTIFIVHLRTSEIAFPDAAMREHIAGHVRILEGHIAACVMVLDVDGFGAALFRTILSTATMLRRSRYPYRVTKDLEDALAWLARHRPPEVRTPTGAADLATAYGWLESRLESKAAPAR